MLLIAALFVICFTGCESSPLGSSRIREWELQFDVRTLRDTPLVDPPKRVAGYFKLDRTHEAEMFYFYFQSRHSPSDPVVLWMTENGPYYINDNLTLSTSEYGWDRTHNVLFVDQPINTGFSYSNDERDRVHDEAGVADDMLDFLQEFFAVHTEIADNAFFVTGESYAGHYVPAVAHRLYQAKVKGEGRPINLQGIAIGNGLTDPAIQFGAYADFALQSKLISQRLHDSISFWYPLCRFGTNLCNGHPWKFICALGLDVCMLTTFERILIANPDINVYDITRKCEGRLCYDFSNADRFLNLPSTRAALGVGDRVWEGCSMDVYQDMMGDWLKNFDTVIPQLMEEGGIRVMIYAGELDLICNWLGNARWVDALPWSRQADWAEVPEEDWTVHGEHAGTVKQLGPLSFVKIAKAGHMVPMDQPYRALAMITSFTRNHPVLHNQALTKVMV